MAEGQDSNSVTLNNLHPERLSEQLGWLSESLDNLAEWMLGAAESCALGLTTYPRTTYGSIGGTPWLPSPAKNQGKAPWRTLRITVQIDSAGGGMCLRTNFAVNEKLFSMVSR